MPWPVYLAYKHLFPTGRRGATLRATLRLAVFVSFGFYIIILGLLWSNHVLARLWADTDSKTTLVKDLGLVWLWVFAGVTIVALIFRSTPFFNAMSIFGITLGVTVLITVQSVMNGFAYQYERVFIETQGHLAVTADGIIENPQEVIQAIKQVPGVTLAEPIMSGVVGLVYQNLPAYPFVRSFDVNSPDAKLDPLASDVIEGSFDDLDDQSILVGAGLAERLRMHVGDSVDISYPRMLEEAKRDHLPMPKELKVAGILESGWVGLDDNTVFLSLRLMREINGFTNEAQLIEVRLANDDLGHTLDLQEVLRKTLQPLSDQRVAAGDKYGRLNVETWQEINQDQMQILFVEKSVMFYIMIVIVIVAAFCILCSLATSVVRKTREIGVLGALGARPAQVAAVFCLQGMFIGLVGTVLGVSLGVLLLHYRQDIIGAFVDQRLILKFYKFYSFPVQYRAWDFAKIIGFTFLISTLAGILPAWWAARLKPAECLRFD